MALIVEDGTGKTDAESYISLADANTYAQDHGDNLKWASSQDPAKEEALRLSTRYLDKTFKKRWDGLRANETQSLDWPRSSVEDSDAYAVDNDTVPQAIKDANVVMAIHSVAEDIFPDLSSAGTIERVKIGSIDVEFMGGNSPLKWYRLAESILSPYLKPRGNVIRG